MGKSHYLLDISVTPQRAEDIKKAELLEKLLRHQYKKQQTEMEEFIKDNLLNQVLDPGSMYKWKK